MFDIPRQVILEGNEFDESRRWNFISAESFASDISIASLIDENSVEDSWSVPSIAKERVEQMSVSTTEDEFEDDTTIEGSANEENDDYDMADFSEMDLSLVANSTSETHDLSYNVTDVTCPLCYVTVDGGEAIVLPGCGHSVCFSCIQDHIHSSRKLSLPICCPLKSSDECSRPIVPSLVKQITALELDADATRSRVYHCCPTVGCTNMLYWKEGNGPPIGDCFKCNQTCCLECGATPYHNHKTCQEYQTHLASLNKPGLNIVPWNVLEERGERNTRRCSL